MVEEKVIEEREKSIMQLNALVYDAEIRIQCYQEFEAELNRLAGRASLALSQLQTKKIEYQNALNARLAEREGVKKDVEAAKA